MPQKCQAWQSFQKVIEMIASLGNAFFAILTSALPLSSGCRTHLGAIVDSNNWLGQYHLTVSTSWHTCMCMYMSVFVVEGNITRQQVIRGKKIYSLNQELKGSSN